MAVLLYLNQTQVEKESEWALETLLSRMMLAQIEVGLHGYLRCLFVLFGCWSGPILNCEGAVVAKARAEGIRLRQQLDQALPEQTMTEA